MLFTVIHKLMRRKQYTAASWKWCQQENPLCRIEWKKSCCAPNAFISCWYCRSLLPLQSILLPLSCCWSAVHWAIGRCVWVIASITACTKIRIFFFFLHTKTAKGDAQYCLNWRRRYIKMYFIKFRSAPTATTTLYHLQCCRAVFFSPSRHSPRARWI